MGQSPHPMSLRYTAVFYQLPQGKLRAQGLEPAERQTSLTALERHLHQWMHPLWEVAPEDSTNTQALGSEWAMVYLYRSVTALQTGLVTAVARSHPLQARIPAA